MNIAPTTASSGPNALSLHHDLWVELARIEMAMETLDEPRTEARIDTADKRKRLEQRRTQLAHALQILPK